MTTKEAITGREMRALETNAEYFGISRLQMMENAGRSIAEEIASRFKPQETRIAVFCGIGGNGGDGSVAARHLACLGFKVEVILAGKAENITDKEAQKNWHALQPLKDLILLRFDAITPLLMIASFSLRSIVFKNTTNVIIVTIVSEMSRKIFSCWQTFLFF